MGPDPPLLEVGRIIRAHGLRGEVVVKLLTDRHERLAVGSVLQGPRGPLEVLSSRPHQGGFLVVFAGVVGRDAAEGLRGAVLSAPPLDDPDTWWVHELIGAEVVGVDGTGHGSVVAVEANPASDLLVLEGGGLVPLRFVTEHSSGRLVIDPPEGLL